MKDSFGGGIMIYIIIFFLGIYIVFIALTLRYAQSFKLKNKVVDLIEQYNGDLEKNDFSVDITNYLKFNNMNPNKFDISVVKNDDVRNSCYYIVSAYIDWEWPFFGIEGVWDIHGETKNLNKCPEESGKVTLKLEGFD